MNEDCANTTRGYRVAMGRLLVLYTQVDRLIMQICAERIAAAPDEDAALALAKQVGDECRHVSIQREWMRRFGTDPTPVLTNEQEAAIRAHFRDLPWIDFLADLYLCVEALGSEAVEKVVPLADPGTRESLHVPLADEIEHVAFGVARLKAELARLPVRERSAYLGCLPERIERMGDAFDDFGVAVDTLFAGVGAQYEAVCDALCRRRDELLAELAAA